MCIALDTTHRDIVAALPVPGTTVTLDGVDGVVLAIGVTHLGDRVAGNTCVPVVVLRDGRRAIGNRAAYLA